MKTHSNTYNKPAQILQHPDTQESPNRSDPTHPQNCQNIQLHIETNCDSDSDELIPIPNGADHKKSNSEPKETPTGGGSAPHIVTLKSSESDDKSARYAIQCAKLRRFIDKFFVLLCLAILIPTAWFHPIGHDDGPLRPRITSSWIATILLFFGFSLGIKLEYVKKLCEFWQTNVFTHVMSYGYYPLIGFLIYEAAISLPNHVLSHDMHALLEGIMILCCLPATGSSSVVFTINAGGNEGAAAITCTISSLIGIFVSPVLIHLICPQIHVDSDVLAKELGLKVIAPFFAAQFIRVLIGEGGRDRLKYSKQWIKKMNEVALLYIVFCILSESFYVGIYPNVGDVCVFLLVVVLLHCHGYLALWILSGCFRGCLLNKSKSCYMKFTIYDRIACIYSGVSKSIVIGIPLIQAMYDDEPMLAMYILPILCYYPTNLIIGSLMVENLRKLTMKEKRFLSTYTSTFTELSLGTDYGALSPFTCKIDTENSFLFAPFALPPPGAKVNKTPLLWSSTR